MKLDLDPLIHRYFVQRLARMLFRFLKHNTATNEKAMMPETVYIDGEGFYDDIYRKNTDSYQSYLLRLHITNYHSSMEYRHLWTLYENLRENNLSVLEIDGRRFTLLVDLPNLDCGVEHNLAYLDNKGCWKPWLYLLEEYNFNQLPITVPKEYQYLIDNFKPEIDGLLFNLANIPL